MRKLNYLFWILSLAMFMGLINCVEKNDEKEGDEKPEFFSIDGAAFFSSDIPAGNSTVKVDISTNEYIINGGTSIVTLNSEEELKFAFIKVKGIDGYYECRLEKVSTTTVYTYQVIINLSQQATGGGLELMISVETVNGKISRIYTCNIMILEANTGLLQINLSWDQLDDLDLHVFDPVGNHISYANSMVFGSEEDYDVVYFRFYCEWLIENFSVDISSLDISREQDFAILMDCLETYGFPDNAIFIRYLEKNDLSYIGHLDIDSNPSCYIDAVNSENIYFPNPIQGEYIIAVDLFEKCNKSTQGSTYAVSLFYKGERIKFSNKQVGKFSDSNMGNYDDENGYVIIGRFRVEGNGVRSVDTTGQDVIPYTKKKTSRLFVK